MTLALLLTAATGAWAADTYNVTFKANGNTKTVENITLPHTFGCNWDGELGRGTGELDVIIQELYGLDGGTCASNIPESDNASVTCDVDDEDNIYIIVNAPFNGTATVTGYYFNSSFDSFNYSLEIICAPAEPAGPTVTINDDKTEASFDMPTSDATVDYELVRDMSVQMNATMGDGTDDLRYRVKKNEQNPGKYEPADMNMLQVLTLVAVNDGIEQKDLTLNQDYYCRIYKLDEQTQQPDGDGVELADFDFAPGLYALKAFAMEGSNYDGETALSNTFKLFEGYELKIAAGEYVTYYKDEALYVEDTDAQLYTITSVNGDKANVVQVDVAKANMPILVKNNSADEKTILLIPTSEQTPDEVSAAEEFVGTLTATEIAASDATTERYAFNGKEFVWVKDAIAVGANRAWLEVPTSFAAGAHAIELVFDGETTRILSVENGELKIENYDYIYNLSGQRVSKDYKGVVVVNGKKVIRK